MARTIGSEETIGQICDEKLKRRSLPGYLEPHEHARLVAKGRLDTPDKQRSAIAELLRRYRLEVRSAVLPCGEVG